MKFLAAALVVFGAACAGATDADPADTTTTSTSASTAPAVTEPTTPPTTELAEPITPVETFANTIPLTSSVTFDADRVRQAIEQASNTIHVDDIDATIEGLQAICNLPRNELAAAIYPAVFRGDGIDEFNIRLLRVGCPSEADTAVNDIECLISMKTASYVVEAFRAQEGVEAESLDQLVEAGVLREDSGLEKYVRVVPGQPGTLEPTPICADATFEP